ncbi:MAG TPA: aryl-sulfate sulfotransferase [Candidatus Saccharimonadales bacterium]|nr:aryl-sulfate sulfotransferase [Candidatus Saccharimonadales bacterium]
MGHGSFRRRLAGASRGAVLGLLCLSGAAVAAARGGAATPIVYRSPVPGSRYVRPQTSVAVRAGARVDPSSVAAAAALVSAVGSRSGAHPGRLVLSDDGRTLVFQPREPFAEGEVVRVDLGRGIRTAEGGALETSSFEFQVGAAPAPAPGGLPDVLAELEGEWASPGPPPFAPGGAAPLGAAAPETLPASFPYVFTYLPGTPSAGRIFVANLCFTRPFTPYLLVLDDAGAPVFYRQMPGPCFDFKLQPNGLLTYYDATRGMFMALDSSYAVVDSFQCGNGYSTDLHELRLLPDGHALLLSYDPETVDMSQVVPGGNPQAQVTGLVVQELDQDKNVIFQWRSWDHFQITDATHEDLTAAQIDYVHGNALEVDWDGNLLLSCRHMDEITKIDRATGEIVWRWGGKHNQFTFVGDSIGFSHQHAVRRIANGDVTLFDNGNFHVPPFSRAAEYMVDEADRIATMVWQYRRSPDVFASAMGYVQRLADGSTLIGWGLAAPAVTEVDPAGTETFELSFAPGNYSYRAYRIDWQPDATSVAIGTSASTRFAQNLPNPFSGRTVLRFSLGRTCVAEMALYDVDGRRVMELFVSRAMRAGDYTLDLDASRLRPGIYFARLVAGTTSVARKLVVIR